MDLLHTLVHLLAMVHMVNKNTFFATHNSSDKFHMHL